ncbi:MULTISPECIES: fatty acid oxidation complex subunit alpha FadJ [Sorangium]|uniref:enoyl-CoA hydratase n=1 Tax=Sorangium cellulosum TaxID=56 RepID=A0A4P2QEV7_SORCE|nr:MULTISPECIES: fatty acid oxidation complex subunit alpha FadJ [Sorangium]AUX27996.1 3-hydroxyacyl-CoA dehydrogenase [Sorangium cellulosum]WCQ87401.1 Fatty acid oxidation complex subunit alpha [Sorangium sp. Soce836]
MTTIESTVTQAPAAKSPVSLEVRPDGVAVVTYDVPGEAVNTLKPTFAGDLERIMGQIASNPLIKAAILVSGKADTWIAGADIDMLKSVTTAAQAEAMCRAGHEAVLRIVRSPKPIVAAIHGAALGGGFEVALACHARVLSDDKKTVLGLPEVQLGLLPGINGLQRLAERAGLQAALDHGLTGKNMRPSKARQLGVADDVVPAPILKETAAALALKLARVEGGPPFRPERAGKKGPKLDAAALTRAALERNPIGRALLFQQAQKQTREKTGGHYPAPERIIEVLRAYAERGFDASREVEARAFGELVVSSTAHRLMELFFATNAMKKDTGVDDPSVQPRKVEKIAMIGAGLMGAGIAYVSLNAGIAVRLRDRDDASLGRGLKYVTDILGDRVKKKQLTPLERDQKLALLTATTDSSGLKSADLVIEAVFEDLAVKHAVLRDVEANGKDGVIVASNTSSIPISRIAAASRRPENVVGMHYFSPVHKMPLLEVIRTEATSPEVVATAVAVGKRQGKTVIVVNDGVGFYTSRILGPYMNEASWLLAEGVSIEQVDRALVAWGWPVGPLALLDEVGIDVAAHIGPIMIEAFGERMSPPPTMAKLVAGDRKGRKNERGMYLYGAAAKKKGKGKHPDESVYAVLGLPVPKAKDKPPVAIEEIQMRCSLQLVNEALYCLGEGILRSPRDGDIGAIFGLGFPPFRGGPFRYVDALGPAEVLRRIEVYERRFGKRWTPAPALVEAARTGKRFYD